MHVRGEHDSLFFRSTNDEDKKIVFQHRYQVQGTPRMLQPTRRLEVAHPQVRGTLYPHRPTRCQGVDLHQV